MTEDCQTCGHKGDQHHHGTGIGTVNGSYRCLEPGCACDCFSYGPTQIVLRLLPDGRQLLLVKQIFNLLLSESAYLGAPGWRRGWEYEHPAPAITAIANWDGAGAPTGWMRSHDD